MNRLARHEHWAWFAAIACTPALNIAHAEASDPDEAREAHGSPSALRLAHSRDGKAFTEVRGVFLDRAAAPDLARLEDGRLMATFDVLSEGAVYPWVAFSTDEGRSWADPVPVLLSGFPPGSRNERDFEQPRHLDAIVGPAGVIKVFFTTGQLHRQAKGVEKAPEEPPTIEGSTPSGAPDAAHASPQSPVTQCGTAAPQVLRAAVSRDGVHYRVDPQVEMRINPPQGEINAAAVIFKDMAVLYADARPPEVKPSECHAAPPLYGYLSRDGRRFARFSPKRDDAVTFIGDLAVRDGRLTGYCVGDGGLTLCESADARTFRTAPCKGPPGVTDVAVARLRDGTWLMLYEVAVDAADRASEPSVIAISAAQRQAAREPGRFPDSEEAATGVDTRRIAADSTAFTAEDFALLVSKASLAPQRSAPGNAQASRRGAHGQSGAGDLSTAQPGDAQSGDSSAKIAVAVGGSASEAPATGQDADASEEVVAPSLGEAVESAFAPLPAFDSWVDYAGWYNAVGRGSTIDDANVFYMEFMPAANDAPGSKPEWPELRNMLADGAPMAHPGPWDPVDHPDWESSYQESNWLAERFRQATLHAGYASPDLRPPDDAASEEEARFQSLLLNIMLPGLSSHRALAKKLISDGWRAPEGRVDAGRMTQSWETVLRGAGQLQRGSTLIEELVGIAEQSLVQDHARWALHQGVFSTPEEIEAALNTLQTFDRYDRDPAQSVRGEHAMAMDSIQYMFWPGEASSEPRPIPERIERFMDLADGAEGERKEEINAMTGAEVRDTVDRFDSYYRTLADQMRIGYPLVRAGDIEALQTPFAEGNPVAGMLMPSLGRYYKLRARSEASRRATQLSYAAHLFHAREGRWPASLDELPDQHRDRVRIDPFTGEDFGYEVTSNGPRVYSRSENGVDDGGVHADRWDDGVEPGSSDDYVFWPPQAKPQ